MYLDMSQQPVVEVCYQILRKFSIFVTHPEKNLSHQFPVETILIVSMATMEI